MRICVSLGDLTSEQCLELSARERFVELRLDRLSVRPVLREICRNTEVIATFRPVPGVSNAERLEDLQEALEAGAAFVDIEVDAEAGYRDALFEAARSVGAKVILSYHDFDRTPPRERLLQGIDECFRIGADLVKIACLVQAPADAANLLGLLGARERLIVVGMGELGRLTRVVAPMLGSAWTFAAPDAEHRTAPGQWTAEELRGIAAQIEAWGMPGGGA